jgi:signal peptidase II
MKLFGPHSAVGLTAGAAVLAADQAHKWYMLEIMRLTEGRPIPVTSFLDLALVWNRGISYGLFKQQSPAGPWLLAIFACITAAAIAVWLAHLPSRLPAMSAGLIMGGAVGNAIDRMRFGAVVDYFSFHIGSWHWYVFNIADVAICLGVAGLLYDWIKSSHKTAGNEI